jgi:hypothetical protein
MVQAPTAPVAPATPPDPYREAEHAENLKRYYENRERMLNALQFLTYASACRAISDLKAVVFNIWSQEYRSLIYSHSLARSMPS